MIHILKKALADTPEGSLKVNNCRGNIQFYQRKPKKLDYLRKENRDIAIRLAQKQYDSLLLKELEIRQRDLKRILSQYEHIDLNMIFYSLHDEIQKLIQPRYINDEDYAKQWEAVPYEKKGFVNEKSGQWTNREERVRSKSEKIIADYFYSVGVPYRYEYPFTAKSGILYHPDFITLNKRTRKQYYWEHLGMMDNPDYAQKQILKLNDFQSSGLFPGKNLLITVETLDCPLDIRNVERLVKEYLL